MRDSFLNTVSYKKILLVSFFISVIFSVWNIYHEPTINGDALVYLKSAELYTKGYWAEGFQTWKWPLFPFLLSIISNVTNLSVEHSAYVLNTLLWAVAILGFIMLTREMGGTLWHWVAAAIIILVYTKINDYRDYIIRDAGYIAFYLLGFLCFLRFNHTKTWLYGLSWAFFMVLAALFRSEGFIFLVLAPLVLLIDRDQDISQRIRMFIKANSLLAALVVVAIFTILLTEIPIEQLEISQKLNIILQTYGTEFTSKIQLVNKYLLNKYSESYGWLVVIATIVIILLYKSVTTIGTLYGLLTLHGIFSKAYSPDKTRRNIWLWFIFINIIILLIFASMRFFLTGRYVLAMVLTIMLITPFSLVRIFNHWKDKKPGSGKYQKYILPGIILIMILMLIDGLVSFGLSKLYVKEAGLWIKNNTSLESTLYSTDQTVNYYAGKKYPYIVLSDLSKAKVKYDYTAVQIKHNKQGLLKKVIVKMKAEPIKIFGNKEGDRVILFKNKVTSP